MRNIKPPTRTMAGPAGIDKKSAANIPPIDDNAPNNAAKKIYLEILTLIFLAAAAGIMTSEPISRVPATLSPNATIKDTIIKKRKLILSTGTFIDFAKSLDNVLMIRSRLIVDIIATITATDIMVINKSPTLILDISPKRVSSNSGSGVSNNPVARLKVKKMPTSVSDGSSVFLSSAQIPMVARNSAANAPKKGLKSQISAKAIPGKAT